MSVEADRALGRRGCWLSASIRGGLVILAMVMPGSGWGADPLAHSQPAQNAMTKLLQGARKADLELVKAAVAEGADVNGRGTNGLTPLLQTVSAETAPLEPERRQCVAFLLELGAKVDAKDNDGRTALILATRAGDLETVRMLVEAGAAIKRRDRFHKTAVLYAAQGKHREILLYLGGVLKVQTGAAW